MDIYKIKTDLRCLLLYLSSFLIAITTFADNDYEKYYKDSTNLVFDINVVGAIVTGKQSGFPEATNANQIAPAGKLTRIGYGGIGNVTTFINPYIAFKTSVGVMLHQLDDAAAKVAAVAYGDKDSQDNTDPIGTLYNIPIGITATYFPMPFGGIRPYVGIGAEYLYPYTDSKKVRFRGGFGMNMEAGVYIVTKADNVFKASIQKTTTKLKGIYRESFLHKGSTSPNTIEGNVENAPFIISFGIGYKL